MQHVSLNRTKETMNGAISLCLKKNEKPTTTARFYGVNHGSICVALLRHHRNATKNPHKGPPKVSGKNKVPREDQELAWMRYVADEADEGLSLTK